MTGIAYIEPIGYSLNMEVNEATLIALLGKQDEKTFENVFKTYYKPLYAYAFTLLKEEMTAEEMVQNVFFKLWERSEGLNISGSIAAYLYRAVHNECLNYLKHLKVRSQHQLYVSHRAGQNNDSASGQLQLKELDKQLHAAINDLPEQCRTIFQMSRFEELRYREIAERLDISVKTVENQMGKALKLLRSKLVDFLVLFLLFIRLLLFGVNLTTADDKQPDSFDQSLTHQKKATLA